MEGVSYQLAFYPVVEEHGAGGGFDDLSEWGQRGVAAALGEAGGVSEKADAGGVVEVGLGVVSEAGGFDEVAAARYLDAVGYVAGVLGMVVEGGEDAGVGGEEVGGGLGCVLCCMEGHHLGIIKKWGIRFYPRRARRYTKVLSIRILPRIHSRVF